ncbi:MAG: hypothetical protein ACI35U_06500 [Marinilabiliaceae bacterium]
MIAGILQVPEMPETQGFAPTLMNNVKAADPLQGIISVQSPQATQSGAATLVPHSPSQRSQPHAARPRPNL